MKNKFDYSYKDIVLSLKSIGLKKGDNVFIQSNVGRFGKLKSAKQKKDYFVNFKNAVLSLIGEEGTLVFPAFSYSFCDGKDFDVKNTKSSVGILSNLALTDDDFVRSEDPNFSILATGFNSKFFTEKPDNHSFGENSFWKRFLSLNGKFLTFNLNNSFLTFRHYIEKKFAVNYRYDKLFEGNIIKDKNVSRKKFFHFVRVLTNPNYVPDRNKFHELAKKMKVIRSARLGKGNINLITANDAFTVGSKGLKENDNFFIKANKVNFEMKPQLNKYFDRLFPICRSLTGNGNRESFKILQELIDIKLTEVPSGTKCFDWTVPPEWNVNDAWIKDSKGNKVVDFKKNNLHLLGYSIPFHAKVSFDELKDHLYSLPNQPDAIPYLTSYYKERWGFCISQKNLDEFDKNDVYEVYIDSKLDKNGSMTIGEALIEGKTKKEILISTYICHPSLANNELSGPLVSSFLYNSLKNKKDLRFTYRFLFVPETIGSIYYLSKKGNHLIKNLEAGYVITCAGDDGPFTYKKSRLGNSTADLAAEQLLKHSEEDYKIVDFFPSGSDERQFCSPGFNLPVGSLMRTMYGKYEEYHTSKDNKSFISFEALEKTVLKYLDLFDIIENNYVLTALYQFCEPQLGKRGLYPSLGSQKEKQDEINSMMWILNYSDGKNDLLSISKKSDISPLKLIPVVKKLIRKGLISTTNN